MRTLFRSMPWNSRRGRDAPGRVWLPRLLIVVVLFFACQVGVWIARGVSVMQLYLLLGSVGLAVLLVRPDLTLLLIPIAISTPSTLPRLFGMIGILEALLSLTGVAWVGNVVVHRRQIRTNEVLNLALLAAVPIVGSAVIGRGDQDWIKAYGWLGGCLTYLLALNLVHDRRTAEKILFWTALVTVGVACLDFLTHGGGLTLEATGLELYIYRKIAFGAGVRQNNSVAAMLALVMPILVAYTWLADGRRQRLVGVMGVILGTLVGLLLLSRTFWAGTAIGLIAQVYVLSRRRGKRNALALLLLLGALVWFVSLLNPTMADLMGRRIEEPIGTRMELSVMQIRSASRSLLWGHGSNLISSRFAHAMIPTALYDYGLIFTLPLFGMLAAWLRQAIRLVKQTDHEKGSAFTLAHLGVVVGMVGIMFFNDFLIAAAGYTCLAFLIAGLLGATVSDQEQEPARAV